MSTALLIIDPQVDFTVEGKGSLVVPNGGEDMERLAAHIDLWGSSIDRIIVTMDTHWQIAIYHPIFWRNGQGERPKPFTTITLEEVENGTWHAYHPMMHNEALAYLRNLKANNRYYPLVIWPEHCLFGSEGWSVHPTLMKALLGWENNEFAKVDYICKGMNMLTEMYSAVRADVIDPNDELTQTNQMLIDNLNSYDTIYVGGEALSHCVANTVRDLIEAGVPVSKFHVLTDAMSNVPGFDEQGNRFLDEISEAGAILCTTEGFAIFPEN